MREFELALHPTKTRLIRFGRHAATIEFKVPGHADSISYFR
jgi:hypothetical protein